MVPKWLLLLNNCGEWFFNACIFPFFKQDVIPIYSRDEHEREALHTSHSPART